MGSFYSDIRSLKMFDEAISYQPENPTKQMNFLLRHGASRSVLEKFLQNGTTRQFSFEGEGWAGIKRHIRYCEKNGWLFSCDIDALIKESYDNVIIKITGFSPSATEDCPKKSFTARVSRKFSINDSDNFASKSENIVPDVIKPIFEAHEKYNVKETQNNLSKILTCVASRVRIRVDSIDHVFRFKRSGIEAWFKVEVVAALGNLVVSLNNKGPDITLSYGLMIELKAATDFNPTYLSGGALKDKVPCLFLGSGEEERNIGRLKSMTSIRVIGLESVRGQHLWVVGCIIPTNQI